MSCPHTPEIIADHCDPDVSAEVLQRHRVHLDTCRVCQQELIALRSVPGELLRWQSIPVPHWDRSGRVKATSKRKTLPNRSHQWSAIRRWLPLAASLVLAVAVMAQTRMSIGPQGLSVSFGAQSPGFSAEQLDEYLTAHANARQAETREWVEAALQTHGQTTADSIYQWITYIEQQRALDVQRMDAGFEQLMNRDFQTVDSVRQLASYVLYQEAP
jgi:hypothetical protein